MGHSQVVTVSVGVGTMLPSRDRSSEDLLRLADQALYEAKAQGRNTIISIDEEPSV